MKIIKNLTPIFVLMGLFTLTLHSYASSSAPIDSSSMECIYEGYVMDMSNLDGCGFVIITEDSLKLQVVSTRRRIILHDSTYVRFGYSPIEIITTCMVGIPVRITCLEEITTNCNANFWYTPILCTEPDYPGCDKLSFQFFADTSENILRYDWSFGDGDTSHLAQPIHIYENEGEYEVQLTIETQSGCIASSSQIIRAFQDSCDAIIWYTQLRDSILYYDTIIPPPVLERTYRFEDRSIGNVINRLWLFSDGHSSTEQTTIHNFDSPGYYHITLEIETSSGCTDTANLELYIPQDTSVCQAAFNYYPVDSLIDPADTGIFYPTNGTLYQFMDISGSDVISRYWEIEGQSDTLPNDAIIQYEFPGPGYYTVCLWIETSDGCTSTTCETIYIENNLDCYASFEYYNHWDTVGVDTFIHPSNTYQFISTSSDNTITWFWNFGDGDTSYEKHPLKTFYEPGSYNVCLTITTSDSCEYQTCEIVFVWDTLEPCTAYFEYCSYTESREDLDSALIIGFKNLSGAAAGYFWDFGDSLYSYEKNPLHIYAEPGIYEVCLQVYGEACFSSYCTQVFVGVDECLADINVFNIEPDCQGYMPGYHFEPETYGQIAEFVYWEFSDGYSTDSYSPLHIFEEYGSYSVCLDITYPNCTAHKCIIVEVEQEYIDSIYSEKCGLTLTELIKDQKGLELSNVYPIPASEQLNMDFISISNQSITIELFNVLGESILIENNIELINGENNISIPIGHINEGQYVYRIRTKEKLISGRISIIN